VSFIHAAGVSPSQASTETLLKVELVLDQFGKVKRRKVREPLPSGAWWGTSRRTIPEPSEENCLLQL
jgi:hypothetical protein